MPDGLTIVVTIIVLFPMLYFLLASPGFLLAKLNIPTVTRMLRGMFDTHFLIVSATGAIAALVFGMTSRPIEAAGVGLIAILAFLARRWFVREMDAHISARDAGDASAVRRLRQVHWTGMVYNAVQFSIVVASIPYVVVARA